MSWETQESEARAPVMVHMHIPKVPLPNHIGGFRSALACICALGIPSKIDSKGQILDKSEVLLDEAQEWRNEAETWRLQRIGVGHTMIIFEPRSALSLWSRDVNFIFA